MQATHIISRIVFCNIEAYSSIIGSRVLQIVLQIVLQTIGRHSAASSTRRLDLI